MPPFIWISSEKKVSVNLEYLSLFSGAKIAGGLKPWTFFFLNITGRVFHAVSSMHTFLACGWLLGESNPLP